MIVCRITPPASERCLDLVRDAASPADIASFMPMPHRLQPTLEVSWLTGSMDTV
jgi:hypothetical protein